MSLKKFEPIGEALAALLYPHAEIVIHNLKTGCIEAIFNNLSKRKPGDASLLDETPHQDVYLPYFKTNWDGRPMKSVSVALKSEAGEAIGLLCINLDVSEWEKMSRFIAPFLKAQEEKPEALFKNDWRERINLYVTASLCARGRTLETLTRAEKQELLAALHREGAFKAKHAAAYVAAVLGVSRATVYNYLKGCYATV